MPNGNPHSGISAVLVEFFAVLVEKSAVLVEKRRWDFHYEAMAG